MPNLKVYNCDSAFLHEDTLLQLEQIFPGLKINQRLLKISTPEQAVDTDFGFCDITACKKMDSYLNEYIANHQPYFFLFISILKILFYLCIL